MKVDDINIGLVVALSTRILKMSQGCGLYGLNRETVGNSEAECFATKVSYPMEVRFNGYYRQVLQ